MLGTTIIFITEPKVQNLSYYERFLASLFQAMSASTTVGFNTLPIGQLSHGVLFVLLILMVTGASPAGTGGGIKSTTIMSVYAQIISTFKGNDNVSFAKRIIPEYRVKIANSSFSFYIIFYVRGFIF